MFGKTAICLILILGTVSCISLSSQHRGKGKVSLAEYVQNIGTNTELMKTIEDFIITRNSSFIGEGYYITNEDAKGYDIVKYPEGYGKIYTLQNIEYKPDSTVLYHFSDQLNNEILYEVEIKTTLYFPLTRGTEVDFFAWSSFSNLYYNLDSKEWKHQYFTGTELNIHTLTEKRYFSVEYLNKICIEQFLHSYYHTNPYEPIDNARKSLLHEFRSYTDSYDKGVYTAKSLERIKNEYLIDQSYHVNYITSALMKNIDEIGSIYRLTRPTAVFGQIGQNTYVVRQIEDIPIIVYGYNTGSNSYRWSDEYVLRVTGNVDTDDLPWVERSDRSLDNYFSAFQGKGQIGYIVRFDGTTQVVTEGGFIRIVPQFTLIGGNKYTRNSYK